MDAHVPQRAQVGQLTAIDECATLIRWRTSK